MRACERECGAAGKTPDLPPVLGKPFAGFVRSSVELFTAFAAAEFLVSPSRFVRGISEVYPGDIWHRLVGRTLPKKSTTGGRRARKLILQALGVIGLPDLPTHDQNDACISALMAAAADEKIAGMSVRGIGSPLARDRGGTLREGPIVIPILSEQLRHSLPNAIRELQSGTEHWNRPTNVPNKVQQKPAILSGSPLQKAIALLDDLVASAREGDARICTYGWAYRHIFGQSVSKWSQAYAKQILSVAVNTPEMELPSLGKVHLDSFIVSSETGVPGDGHWKCSDYDREEWERVLGTATVLR